MKLNKKEYVRHQMTFCKPSPTGKILSADKGSLAIYRADENIGLHRMGQTSCKLVGGRSSYKMTVPWGGGGLIYIH